MSLRSLNLLEILETIMHLELICETCEDWKVLSRDVVNRNLLNEQVRPWRVQII